MIFASGPIFRKAVRQHAILDQRPIDFMKNKNLGAKIKFVCKAPCLWLIYARQMQRSSSFQIRTINDKHICTQCYEQKQINASWIAEAYENDIRLNPTWKIPNFLAKVTNDLKCKVSYMQAFRAKQKALDNIRGKHEVQYGKLWDYATEIRRAMPGSTVKLLTEDAMPNEEIGRFLRLYVCLGPLKEGFRKGKYSSNIFSIFYSLYYLHLNLCILTCTH